MGEADAVAYTDTDLRGRKEGSKSNDARKNLVHILLCPQCSKFPSLPIFTCTEGHFTCNTCSLAGSKCTICQLSFTKTRNLSLEEIILNTPFDCEYLSEGCEEKVDGRNYEEHLKDCPFGPVVCLEKTHRGSCGSLVKISNYENHFREQEHAVIRMPLHDLDYSDCVRQELGDEFPQVWFSSNYFGRDFILNTCRYKSFVCWWVTSIRPKELEDYNAELLWVKKKDTENRNCLEGNEEESILRWARPVFSIRKSFTEIRDAGLCAVLPETHLPPMGNPTDKISSWNLRLRMTKKDRKPSKSISNIYVFLLLFCGTSIASGLIGYLSENATVVNPHVSDIPSSEALPDHNFNKYYYRDDYLKKIQAFDEEQETNQPHISRPFLDANLEHLSAAKQYNSKPNDRERKEEHLLSTGVKDELEKTTDGDAAKTTESSFMDKLWTNFYTTILEIVYPFQKLGLHVSSIGTNLIYDWCRSLLDILLSIVSYITSISVFDDKESVFYALLTIFKWVVCKLVSYSMLISFVCGFILLIHFFPILLLPPYIVVFALVLYYIIF